LREPLRSLQALSHALLEEHGAQLDRTGPDRARRILAGLEHMDRLIRDLLDDSKLGHVEPGRSTI
jgi:light-regulated signal transduction histidine kinase (bacteriophytochrome)